MSYVKLYEYIVRASKEASDPINKMLERRVFWEFNLYLDISYSGSAIDIAKDWSATLGDPQTPVWSKPAYIGEQFQFKHYQETNALLQIDTFAACSEGEALIELENGSLWINTYLAKGIEPKHGQVLSRSLDDMEKKNTTQTLRLIIV